MHKQAKNGLMVIVWDCMPTGKRINWLFVLLFFVASALCLVNSTQTVLQDLSLVSVLIIVFYILSGFVFVSGDTVMAAQYFFFFTRKIKKLKDNISQNQLTCGHFPGTNPVNQSGFPFFLNLWFSSGILFNRLPVFYCPQQRMSVIRPDHVMAFVSLSAIERKYNGI